jgi:hypothetical protein
VLILGSDELRMVYYNWIILHLDYFRFWSIKVGSFYVPQYQSFRSFELTFDYVIFHSWLTSGYLEKLHLGFCVLMAA